MNEAPLRPLTPAARKQLSRELPVRVWTLAAAIIALIAVGTAIHGVLSGIEDRKLLSQGVKVNARVDFISGGTRNADRSQPQQVSLSFLMPGKEERDELVKVMLPSSPSGGFINKGDTLPILIDPKDKRKWTDRTEPEPWLVVMAAPMLLTPVAFVLAIIALRAGSTVRKLYEHGTIVAASVSEAHRSALIPGQKRLKLSIAGRKLFAAYPDALGPVGEGEALDAIVDNPAAPRQAIIARAYGLGAAQQS